MFERCKYTWIMPLRPRTWEGENECYCVSSRILFQALSMFALVIAYNTGPLGALCPSIIIIPFHFPFQILLDTLRPLLPWMPATKLGFVADLFLPFLMAFFLGGYFWIVDCRLLIESIWTGPGSRAEVFVYIEQPTATESFNTSDQTLSQWSVHLWNFLIFPWEFNY